MPTLWQTGSFKISLTHDRMSLNFSIDGEKTLTSFIFDKFIYILRFNFNSISTPIKIRIDVIVTVVTFVTLIYILAAASTWRIGEVHGF